MGFPEVGLDRQRGLENRLRLGELRRVALDGALPRRLERALELGVADAETQPTRLARALAALLLLEQSIELARRALAVTRFVDGAREIQPNDRGSIRGERRLVARDRIGALAARVQRGGVRRVQLPTRRARGDRPIERRAARLEVAALERDDRRELLRRAVGSARRRYAPQVRERGGARTGIRVELRQSNDVRVRQRTNGVGVLERHDRLVDVAGLGSQLRQDVVRPPRTRANDGEILECADLATDVAALEGLSREHEQPLLSGAALPVRAERSEITLQRAPDRFVRAGLVALPQECGGDLLVHPFEKRRVCVLIRRSGRIRVGPERRPDRARQPPREGGLARGERPGVDADRTRGAHRAAADIDERDLEAPRPTVLAVDARERIRGTERTPVL